MEVLRNALENWPQGLPSPEGFQPHPVYGVVGRKMAGAEKLVKARSTAYTSGMITKKDIKAIAGEGLHRRRPFPLCFQKLPGGLTSLSFQRAFLFSCINNVYGIEDYEKTTITTAISPSSIMKVELSLSLTGRSGLESQGNQSLTALNKVLAFNRNAISKTASNAP